MHYILIFGPCCPLIFQYLFTVMVWTALGCGFDSE